MKKKFMMLSGTRLNVTVVFLLLFRSVTLYSQSCSITASNDTVLYQSPDTIQLNAVISGLVDSCTIISWTPTAGLSNPAILDPVAIVSSSVTYTVTAYISLDSNLFVNGDFEQGNNFFGTTYNYYCPSYPNYIDANDYCVTDNPHNVHSGAANCPDHTSGTGMMMVVNGSTTAPSEVWSQILTLKQNTHYCFTFWSMNWSYFLNFLPTFDLEINGVMQGLAFTIDPATCAWKKFKYTWYSGNDTTTEFKIMNLSDDYEGNDFCIDDISLIELCPATDSVIILVGGPAPPQTSFSATDTLICEKFCMDFFDQSTNNPTSWQWNFPGGVPSSSALQNPTNICYNLPGLYDVTLIATNALGSDTLVLTDYITVYPTPPTPTITQNGNVLTCSPADSYQWQLNGTDIPGATMQSYTYTQTGLFTVYTGDSHGCTNNASILITAVETMGDEFSVSVFPNPSDGNFIVELINCPAQNISLRILNILGEEVVAQNFACVHNDFKKEIDLRNVAEGVYFIEMRTGNEFIRKKIIVAK